MYQHKSQLQTQRFARSWCTPILPNTHTQNVADSSAQQSGPNSGLSAPNAPSLWRNTFCNSPMAVFFRVPQCIVPCPSKWGHLSRAKGFLPTIRNYSSVAGAESSRAFVLHLFWRIFHGFRWRIFSGSTPHKTEEQNPVPQSAKRLKN